MTWNRDLLILAYRSACQYYRRAARLYDALADHERDSDRRALLQMLSRQAVRYAGAHAGGLALLHVPVPEDRDTMLDRAWRWWLVRCGVRVSLARLAWDELSYAVLLELSAKTTPKKKPGNFQQH